MTPLTAMMLNMKARGIPSRLRTSSISLLCFKTVFAGSENEKCLHFSLPGGGGTGRYHKLQTRTKIWEKLKTPKCIVQVKFQNPEKCIVHRFLRLKLHKSGKFHVGIIFCTIDVTSDLTIAKNQIIPKSLDSTRVVPLCPCNCISY